MDQKNLKKLGELVKLELSEEELESFPGQFKKIIEFVGEIKELRLSEKKDKVGELRNIFREDKKPHTAGENREEILEAMPRQEKGYLRVRKILER